jgi:hypothetical protein
MLYGIPNFVPFIFYNFYIFNAFTLDIALSMKSDVETLLEENFKVQ